MKELRLLIVEDDDTVISGYQSNITSFNKTNGEIQIRPLFIKNKDEAIDHLRNPENNFDGAIIDLDLKKSGGDDSSGNEVIKEVKNNLRFPVFVISGTAHNIDESLNEETAFFKVRNRDAEFDYIEEMVSIYNTGITNIINRKGTIEKYISDIFWKHLSNSLDVWINDSDRAPEEKQKTLLRYTLLHIQEHLEISPDSSSFEDYHPAEIYITPTIKPNVFTGDIVSNSENDKYIVLTPSCDLAQSKAKDILLVYIESENSGLILEKKNIIQQNRASQDIIKKAEDELKALINNSFSNKYHFLPKYKDLSAGLINFQKITSIRAKDFNKDFNRIASINSSFTKDIVARFSYYYSRQGSPDFNVEEVYNSLL